MSNIHESLRADLPDLAVFATVLKSIALLGQLPALGVSQSAPSLRFELSRSISVFKCWLSVEQISFRFVPPKFGAAVHMLSKGRPRQRAQKNRGWCFIIGGSVSAETLWCAQNLCCEKARPR